MAMARGRMIGISRIDQPDKRTHGYFVRLTRRGQIYPAFFADKTYGGKEKALRAAHRHYQKLLRAHGPAGPRGRARKRPVELEGVQRVIETRSYWVARWSPRPRVIKEKRFSVERHGESRAKALALRAQIAWLRSQLEQVLRALRPLKACPGMPGGDQ